MKFPKKLSDKSKIIYLNHCGVSPLYQGAVDAGHFFAKKHHALGINIFSEYGQILDLLHKAVASFLSTKDSNISFIRNTAEGLSMIAESFPFKKGDEIISYEHEYPSNHYPWLLQTRKGVKLILLKNSVLNKKKISENIAHLWSLEDLERAITKKTRIIALSHVQFTSGFSANLKRLGNICKNRNIFLIVDAAQSMGAMPLYPEKWNISAITSSGWKWLMGPIGSGLLYTSPNLRDNLSFTMAGADLMKQGENYLDHRWRPYKDGRRFEYSTPSYELAYQLLACFDDIFNKYSIEKIYKRIVNLQHIFLKEIDMKLFYPIEFPPEHSSCILSMISNRDPRHIAKDALTSNNLCISARENYVRIGIHFYNTPEKVKKAAKILNRLGAK